MASRCRLIVRPGNDLNVERLLQLVPLPSNEADKLFQR
jgi:hypothetical protein